MKAAVLVVLLLAACVVGLLVAGWLEESGPVEPDTDDTAHDATTSPDDARSSDATPGDASEDETKEDASAGPLVPRVLPPDAALEDVRDALVAKDPSAVRAAYERITRLSLKNASFGSALKRLAGDESDKAVALIVRRASVTPWSELTDAQREELLAVLR